MKDVKSYEILIKYEIWFYYQISRPAHYQTSWKSNFSAPNLDRLNGRHETWIVLSLPVRYQYEIHSESNDTSWAVCDSAVSRLVDRPKARAPKTGPGPVPDPLPTDDITQRPWAPLAPPYRDHRTLLFRGIGVTEAARLRALPAHKERLLLALANVY